MPLEFRLPDIGEGIHEGEIVQWMVKPGDTVAEDQPLVEVMTDKVTAEIPSPYGGVVKELKAQAGQVVQVGSVIITFDAVAKTGEEPKKQESKAEAQKKPSAAEAGGNGKPHSTPAKGSCAVATRGDGDSCGTGGKVLAAPATRKLAREMGVALMEISGTGPRGRITQADVRQFVESGGAATRPGNGAAHKAPAYVTPAGYGERETRKPFAGMRRKIAEHLVTSKHTAPHFAYVEEVDMTEIVALRDALLPDAEAQGVKLTFLPFIIKAVIAGLKAYPSLNASLDEPAQELVYKNYYNMGVAVATDQGLIVPVVKDADQKNMLTLGREIKDLADRARAGKLTLDDLKGGTFTLTSIGSIGGLFSVPIINYPEVAILGVNKIVKRPVVRNDEIVIRQMMHLSISCDHRVVDGAEAALFVKKIVEYLEQPGRLLLEG